MSKQYFVSYTQTSDDGRRFGFGNCYVWLDALTVKEMQKIPAEVEKLVPEHKNVVVMSIHELKEDTPNDQ
jgi:hypothetical protein